MSGDFFLHNLWWHEQQPYLVYSRSENQSRTYRRCAIGEYVAWQRLPEKRCPGYINLRTSEYISCKYANTIIAEKVERCSRCEHDFGFKAGFLFREYTSKDARYYFEQDHYLYIAIHHENKLKVGTANALRKYDRLYEQGATMFALIARGSFERIKNLEQFISRTLEISQRSPSTTTINLALSSDVLRKCELMLNQSATDAIQLLKRAGYNENIIHPYDVTVITPETANYTGSHALISRSPMIYGEITAVVGRFLVVRSNDTCWAYDKNLLVGHRFIQIADKDVRTQEFNTIQLNLPIPLRENLGL